MSLRQSNTVRSTTDSVLNGERELHERPLLYTPLLDMVDSSIYLANLQQRQATWGGY